MMRTTTDPLLVPLSKTKITLIFFGSAAFVAAGFWLPSIAAQTSFHNPVLVKAAAIASIGFFGLCGLYALFKLFDRAPGLIIDADGIIDNSSAVSAARIPWSDICGFAIRTVQRQRFLTIEVRNPEHYVQRASFLVRPLIALNTKHFGGPIQISSNALKTNFDELVRIVMEFHAKHGITG